MRALVALVARGVLVASAAPAAYAQPADVPALIKLIETQPADMDRSAWKEKRREAARKLVASKDKRAVPVLIKLAETETFDIIGEIAIEGLGNLGDQSAVAGAAEDRRTTTRATRRPRELAKKALAKLGASATGGGTAADGRHRRPTGTALDHRPPRPAPRPEAARPTSGGDGGDAVAGGSPGPATADGDGGTDPSAASGGGSVLLGERAPSTGGPRRTDAARGHARGLRSPDVRRRRPRRSSYDTVRKRPAFDVDVAARYAKRVERETDGVGRRRAARTSSPASSTPRAARRRAARRSIVDGGGEARFYRGKLYGVGKAAAGVADQLHLARRRRRSERRLQGHAARYADLQVALGGGYGRVLDVGGAIRVRRLSRTLDAARALGKPIDAATARRLQLTWWALRGERSSYPRAGRDRRDPARGRHPARRARRRADATRSSPCCATRSCTCGRAASTCRSSFGEGYLLRPDRWTTIRRRRSTSAAASSSCSRRRATASSSHDDKTEISGTAFARLRLFAPDDQPSPWAVGATARLRRFTYGEHGDPFGALDVAATILHVEGRHARERPDGDQRSGAADPGRGRLHVLA